MFTRSVESILHTTLKKVGFVSLRNAGQLTLPEENGYCAYGALETYAKLGWPLAESHPNRRLIERDIAADKATILQMLPRGILSEPPYRQQEEARTCIPASFLGIVEAITGKRLEEKPFMRQLIEANLTEAPHIAAGAGKAIFSLLREEFADRYGETYACEAFGFDFNSLKVAHAQAKAYDPRAKLYYMASVASEVNPTGTHLITVLYADENYVYVHDPSNIEGVGGAVRKLEKREYFDRWAKAGMDGVLVIHFPHRPVSFGNSFELQMA